MVDIIENRRNEIADLCRRFGVRQLELFGSATGAAFDPVRSDLDFLLDFDTRSDGSLFDRYFGLKEELEEIFSRNVDLVMVGALRNPYFIASVNKTRQLVYAAPVDQAA